MIPAMLRLTLFLVLLCPLFASAGSLTVTWQPPTRNDDGSALTNLAGYRLYYGNAANTLDKSVAVNVPTATSTIIDALPAGVWFVSMTAISSTGVESVRTTPVSKTLAADPVPTPLVTLGGYGYCATGTDTAPSMTAIGYVPAGLPCGPSVRTVGGVKFCKVTVEQVDKVSYCAPDKPLARGAWARAAP
jgi:hypothetical protein